MRDYVLTCPHLPRPRALVAEALEISFFMARLAEDDKNVEVQLEMKEWARFEF